MPTRFLSDAEIRRLESFPECIERRDLARFFTLASQDDLAFVRGQRGAPNQLGIALQLGSLRWLGFIRDDEPPERIGVEVGDAELAARQPLDRGRRQLRGSRQRQRRGRRSDDVDA